MVGDKHRSATWPIRDQLPPRRHDDTKWTHRSIGVHVPLFISSWLRGADQTPAIEVALYFGLSAKPADCRVDTVVLRQDAKVAKSAKKGREKQRLLPWRFLASLGIAWRDATTTRGGR